MSGWLVAIASAFWLGILTAISPCPLATNIAAISYVSRKVGKPSSVFSAGLLYTCGRTLTYLLLGVILVSTMLSVPVIAHVLQKYMNMALGPLLILVGMILLELISFNIGGGGLSAMIQKRADAMGIYGAGLLGIVFALSFCPTSAALFFGSLLPLALEHKSEVALPMFYGVATGLPVLVFAVCLSMGANRLSWFYSHVSRFEKGARKITGIIFILVGIYYCLTNIFKMSILN